MIASISSYGAHGFYDGNWVALIIYIGFLCYIGFSFYTGQTELYIRTVAKESNPVLYWITMIVFSVIAVYIGKDMYANLYLFP
jgi:hypothetical protein